MHVVIDTSIYRKDPKREKASFRALERLASGKKLTLHIPEVVQREFLTQQATKLTDTLREVASGASSILRSNTDDDLGSFAEQIKLDVEQLLEKAIDISAQEFASWTAEMTAEVHPIADNHGQRVMDAYFSGNPPFKSPKSRADIPDSFIWESVLDLAAKHETVSFICADGLLRDAAKGQAGVEPFESLESFIQSAECQQALTELTAEITQAKVLRVTNFLPEMEAFLRDQVEADLTSLLDGKDVTGRNIPDDNNEATIIMVDSPDTITFNFAGVDYYGEAELGLPFSASVECTLNYAIFKSDYHCLTDEKAERISIDERNDHYYDADENYTIEVTGTVLISMDETSLQSGLTDEELSDLIESAEFGLEADSIEVEGGEEF